MEMEEKKNELTEAALPVQELPADIPDEVRQKLVRDLNEEATEDLKQDIREAEKEEARDDEVKADPEMLTKSRLLKMLVKKQYVKLREVTEEEQPADLAELLEELDENNRLVVFRLLKKEVATEAFAYMSDEARDDLVNAFSDVELVSAIEEMSLDDAADLLEDMPAGVVKRVLEKSSRETRESLNKLLNYPESSAGSLMTPEYVRLRKDMTVEQAFTAIRKQGENAAMGARANTVHGFAHGLNGGSAGGTTGTRLFARLAHADAAVGFNDELHAGAAFLESEKVTNFLGDRDLPLDGKTMRHMLLLHADKC